MGMSMRVGIFGTGYAGLATAVGLAEVGHTVTATDKDPDIVARLSDGTPIILPHGAETGARMSVRRRSSVTVTRGQNSQVPV